ncbi:MAG: Flp family type IVb pilin [Longimicrobiales bacterium]
MKNLVARFLKDESGVSSIEYAILASMIALVILAAVQATGTTLQAIFQSVVTALSP